MNINQYVEQTEELIKMSVCVLVVENVENIEKENVILFINVLIAWVFWIEFAVKTVSRTIIGVIYSV